MKVDLGTKHNVFDVPKWVYITVIFIFKLGCLAIGIFIGKYLCDNCIHCNTCNPIVASYLSIVSLSCLINIGLPIDKLANVSMSK